MRRYTFMALFFFFFLYVIFNSSVINLVERSLKYGDLKKKDVLFVLILSYCNVPFKNLDERIAN